MVENTPPITSCFRMAAQCGLIVVLLAFGCGGGPDGKTDTGVDTGMPDAGDRADTVVAPDIERDTVERDAQRPDTAIEDTGMDAAVDAEKPGEVCDDGVDNDENGDTDCADAACSNFPRCTFTEMSSGRSHACGVVDSGEVVCWGYNGEGQLGNGEVEKSASRPVFVEGIDNAVDVTAALQHTCARLADGGVRCWGRNDRGQLGDDSFASSPFPVEVAGITDARDVSAGGKHTCAVVGEAGDLWCWGDNAKHQAGSYDEDRRRTPGPVASFGGGHTGFQSISTGIDFTCALRVPDTDAPPDEQLRYAACWGGNGVGQLGVNRENLDDFGVPFRVKAGDKLFSDVVPGSLAAGQQSTCLIREGGSVWCWGDGTNGNFGSEDYLMDFQYQAVEVPGLGDARRLWHELFHVCAERDSGRVVCWGDSSTQAFAEETKAFLDPVLLGDLQSPRDVAPGDLFTCWATADGRGYCRGAGESGQLGRPIDSNSTPEPQRVLPQFDAEQ